MLGVKEVLDKVYDRQEKMAEDLGEIKITLAKQEESLRTHIYRTELAEKAIEVLEDTQGDLGYRVTSLEQIPLSIRHIGGITAKLVGVLAALAGITYSIHSFLK